MIKIKSKIGEDGLNSYQRVGLKHRGGNNPSRKLENRKKISDGVKKFIKENPERVKEIQKNIQEAMLKKMKMV